MIDLNNNKNTPAFIYNLPEKVLFHPKITLLQLQIYAIVRSFMDTTGIAYCSNNWIAKKCGVQRNAVIVGINKLISYGFLRKKTVDQQRYLEVVLNPVLITDFEQTSIPKDTQLDLSIIKLNKDNIYISEPEKIEQNELNPVQYQETYYEQHKPDAQSTGIKFEQFWSLYPAKKNKLRAQALWNNYNLDVKADEILQKLSNQIKNDSQWLDGYIPSACNYLTNERWNDEISIKTKKQKENISLDLRSNWMDKPKGLLD